MKREVLRVFRLLHRTCRNLFQNDHEAMNAARLKIHEEFMKHQSVTDAEELSKLVTQAREADEFMRTHVVQATLTPNNAYRLRITKDTYLPDNAPLPEHLKKQKPSQPTSID